MTIGDDVGEGIGDGVGDDVGDNVGDDVGDDVGDNNVGDDVGDNVGDGVGLRRIAPLGFRRFTIVSFSISAMLTGPLLLDCSSCFWVENIKNKLVMCTKSSLVN